jgi:hypothetical protein
MGHMGLSLMGLIHAPTVIEGAQHKNKDTEAIENKA